MPSCRPPVSGIGHPVEIKRLFELGATHHAGRVAWMRRDEDLGIDT